MTTLRTSLRHAPGEATSQDELRAMAKAAWKRGVLVVWVDDIPDPWERQVLTNIGERDYGKR